MSAPGPANLNTAKGILATQGLKDGDYTIDQLDQGEHVNALKAGTFDAAYTLEPGATIMRNLGIADTVEAGVIAKYILGTRTPTRMRPAAPSPPSSSPNGPTSPSASRRRGRRRSTSSAPIPKRRASTSPRTP